MCVGKRSDVEAQPSPSPSAPRWEPRTLTNFKRRVARYSMKPIPQIAAPATSMKCNEGCRNPRKNQEEEASREGQ